MAKINSGVCRLTGASGRFVKAHILPKSLARPEKPGIPFIQSGQGEVPIRRWSSWVDHQLVIKKGEMILEELDTWAIRALRSYYLVWSGWNNADSVPADQMLADMAGRGGRRIEGVDPARLRLFTLSLLWRAAASDLREMSEIQLPPDDLKKLGCLLRDGNPGPISFYPAQFIQISTRGQTQNLTPIASTKLIPGLFEQEPERHIPIFRFYLDGLIIHFHRHADDEGYTAALGDLIVGASSRLFVTTIPYEGSFQKENLDIVMKQTEIAFPFVLDKLLWPFK